jgi:hypothetical protein
MSCLPLSCEHKQLPHSLQTYVSTLTHTIIHYHHFHYYYATTIRHHGDRPCSFPRSLPCLVLPLWVADLFHELDSPGTCHWCQFSSWWLYTKIATPTSEATVAKQATSLREQLEAAQENPTSQEKTIKSHEAITRHLTKERSAATETGARCQNECGLFKLRL